MFNQVSADPGNKVVTFGANSSVLNASWAQTRDRGCAGEVTGKSPAKLTQQHRKHERETAESSPSEYRDVGKFGSWSSLGKEIKSEGIAVPLSEKPDAFFHAQRDFFLEVVVLFVVEEQQSEWRACFPRWWTVSTLPRPTATPPSTRPRRVFVVGRRLEPPSGHAHNGDATRRPTDGSVARSILLSFFSVFLFKTERSPSVAYIIARKILLLRCRALGEWSRWSQKPLNI